ncbi:MAG: hypothetical protein IKJ33_00180 [Clostridia bacterium]|nr:hypothetical protein [Clostridia bacterium]
MEAVATKRMKGQGIISFKGIFDSIDRALDNADTKRAERQYEKIRKQMLEEGTGKTEAAYNEMLEFMEKTKHLKPYEIRQLREDIKNGKRKVAHKQRKQAYLALLMTFGNKMAEKFTEKGLITIVLGLFGVVAEPALTIATCAVEAGILLWSIRKLKKAKAFEDAEEKMTAEDSLKDFEDLAKEVKQLCDEIDKTKAQDIQSLKLRQDKSKRVSAKEFKKIFAKHVIEIIDKMNLQQINKDQVIKAYGIEDEVNAMEAQEAQRAEAEAQEIEAREAARAQEQFEIEEKNRQEEEKRAKEEKERKLLEELNGEREQN